MATVVLGEISHISFSPCTTINSQKEEVSKNVYWKILSAQWNYCSPCIWRNFHRKKIGCINFGASFYRMILKASTFHSVINNTIQKKYISIHNIWKNNTYNFTAKILFHNIYYGPHNAQLITELSPPLLTTWQLCKCWQKKCVQ